MDLTDKQIKAFATKQEKSRVFEGFDLPAKDIWAKCSDGMWVRKAWHQLNKFGWGKWEKWEER